VADTLEVFGTEYTGVTGIKATDDNGDTLTYIRPLTVPITFVNHRSTNAIVAYVLRSGIVNANGYIDNNTTFIISGNTTTTRDLPSGCMFYMALNQTYGNFKLMIDNVLCEPLMEYSEVSGTGSTLIKKVYRITSTVIPNTGGTIDIYDSSDPVPAVYTADTLTVTVNDTYTAPANTAYTSVTVAVPSPSAGTEGTPVATKGTVSNHSVSVTPSVTNTGGVITGGTHTGTAVTVTASELASGNKSITENGNNIDVVGYSTVSVNVPTGSSQAIINDTTDSAGGTIREITTDTTLTLSPLLATQNQTYTPLSGTAYSEVVVNVSGGGAAVEEKQVNFIDYDGTLLYSYTANEANALTSLPVNPSHTGLTAQGWNWTLSEIKAQLTAMPTGDIWVGQMYVTTSGDTEIDVLFQDSVRLSPYLSCCVNGAIEIDWGDNTTPSTLTGTSLSDRVYTQHTYASTGEYTITISVEDGSWRIGAGMYLLLGKNESSSTGNVCYSGCVTGVRLGSNVELRTYAFYNCYSLRYITVPNGSLTDETTNNTAKFSNTGIRAIVYPRGITKIQNSDCSSCSLLEYCSLPSTITEIGGYAFSSTQCLKGFGFPASLDVLGTYFFGFKNAVSKVVLPSNMTSIGDSAFNSIYNLQSINIPNGILTIESNTFQYCYGLSSITIPSSVSTISSGAFGNCTSLKEIHVLPTTPPMIVSATFGTLQSDCIIYVPSASLSNYQTTNVWKNYASYMVGE